MHGRKTPIRVVLQVVYGGNWDVLIASMWRVGLAHCFAHYTEFLPSVSSYIFIVFLRILLFVFNLVYILL